MRFKQKLEMYTFSPGLVSYRTLKPHERNPKTANEDPSGNGIRDASLAVVVAKSIGEYTPEWEKEFEAAINACAIEDGLYKRTPRKPDQQGPDDYIWLAAASVDFARKIVWHGENRKGKILGLPLVRYTYNTEKPQKFTFSAWLGRQPQLVAHFWACAGVLVPETFAKQWASHMYAASHANPNDGDAWLHSWALHKNPPNYEYCKKAAAYWRESILEKYGPTWAQGIAARTLEPGHPIGKYFVF